MKYYKLVNDIPMFKKGDLFFIHPEEGCLLQKDTLRLAYHKKTLEKNPEILKDWFEETSEKHKRWRAKENDEYCYIDDYGDVEFIFEDMDELDDYRYGVGDYFKTEKEAEAYKEYLIARQVLLDDAEGGKFVPRKFVYYADYMAADWAKEWEIGSTLNAYTPGRIYFKDKEPLEKSLNEHKEQWEIVRKYEMGEM